MKALSGMAAAALLSGCGETAAPPAGANQPIRVTASEMTRLGDLSRGRLACRISRKQVCDEEECRAVEAEVWNVIDLEAETYARCDRLGCDTYPATMSLSGMFKSVALPESGAMAKVGTDGSFVETVTMGTTAYVSHGRCTYQQAVDSNEPQ